jgi:hypothetical protein
MSTTRHASSGKAPWVAPSLLVLSVVPTIAGAHRLAMMASIVAPGRDAARFLAAAPMLAVHIVSACTFAIVGAFQLAPSLRAAYPKAHARTGYVAAPMGLVSALSGLGLTLSVAPGPHDGPALFVMRMVVGLVMVGELVLGLLALRRRRYLPHGAWMVRAYALGLGAGTQVLTHLPLLVAGSEPTVFGRAVAMGAGWALNAAVAEWVVRAQRNVPPRVRAPVPRGAPSSPVG